LLKVYIEDQFIEEDTEVIDTEEIIAQDPVIEEEEQEAADAVSENETKEETQHGGGGGGNSASTGDGVEDEGVKKQTITFDDIDRVRILNDSETTEELVNAPKTLERYEKLCKTKRRGRWL
jgi:hypothetical protein